MLVLAESELSTMIMSSENSVVPAVSTDTQNATPGICHDYPHSPSASTPSQHHIQTPGGPCSQLSPRLPQQNHQWDINDSSLPMAETFDPFELWPSGHYRRVYRGDSDDARRHVSGWAMRNTNNHNALILKKSCLGVLVCSLDCLLDSGRKVHLRPAICDKARRKQIGKPCPNPGCGGKLTLLSCRGHCGYPVTHFWRHVNNSVFFQAKGYHDHPRPEVKSLSDKGRHAFSKQLRQDGDRLVSVPAKRRFPILTTDDIPERKLFIPSEEEVMCSCPPFECVCPKSAPHKTQFVPSAFGHLRDTSAHTFIPHRSPPEQVTHGPFTQINITNTCLPPSALDVGLPSIEIYKNCSKLGPSNYYHNNDMKIFRYSGNDSVGNPLPHAQHIMRSPIDELRSSQVINCPNPVGFQHIGCSPWSLSSGVGAGSTPNIYVSDGRDEYGRCRMNTNQCYSKNRGIQLTNDRSEGLGLSLKTEPGEIVFTDMSSSPRGEQGRSFPVESMYNSISPAFTTDPLVSPRAIECQSKFERSSNEILKEHDQQEGPQELTYITLTSPPRQNESRSNNREYHSCRLSHMNRSPSTVASSVEANMYPAPPTQSTVVENIGTDVITESSPRHQDSRDMSVTPLSSTPSRCPSPTLPRLVLNDGFINSAGNPGRSNALHTPFTSYHEPSSGPFSLSGDNHVPSYPSGGPAFGSNPNMPYGFYCNDMFPGPSQQAYRNRSINITLTYN